jgi:predicted nucleotidyltransferase
MIWKPDPNAKLEIEEDPHWDALQSKISNDEGLAAVMLESYQRVCGLVGRDVFQSTTLPRALRLMKGKYRTMTRELLRIIEHGSSLRRHEIGSFLENVLPETGPDYEKQCEKYRKEMLEKLSEALNKSFGRLGRCQIKCDVVAAVVYGSMAKQDNHTYSDVDFKTFTHTQKGSSIYIFQRELDRLGVPHDGLDVHSVRSPKNSGLGEGDDALIVLSPDITIQESLHNYLKTNYPKCDVKKFP